MIGSEPVSTANIRYTVPLTPLEERIEAEAAHLSIPLAVLRQRIGNAEFDKYINSLVALRKVEDQLLLLTKQEMYRSIIVSRYLPVLKECFGVSFIRVVVSQ